jgi:hypothetical protein
VGLYGGLRIHPCHITHKPLRIKKQEVNHNILGSPTQLCDAAYKNIAGKDRGTGIAGLGSGLRDHG